MTKLDVTRTLLKAQAAARDGRPEEAEAAFRAVLDRYPANAKARAGLQRLLAAAVERRAAGQGGSAASAEPIPDVSLDVARALHAMRLDRRFTEFDAALENALRTWPRSATLHNMRGVSLIDRERPVEAVEAFNRVVAIAPAHATGHVNLGSALIELGRFEEATKAFDRAATLAPNDPDIWHKKGDALRGAGQSGPAAACYRRALDLAPEYAASWNGLAWLSFTLRDHETAIHCFSRAARFAPELPRYRVSLARAQLAAGLRDVAAETIDSLENASGLLAEDHQNIAQLQQDLGRPEDAIRSYEAVTELEPGNEAARARLMLVRRDICDWRCFRTDVRAVSTLGVDNHILSPWGLLPLEDAPERQRRRSVLTSHPAGWTDPRRDWPPLDAAGRRLRVGYLSADLINHATMNLISGLFREHDRDRFEVSFISYKAKRRDDTLERALRDGDLVLDLTRKSDEEFVAIVRDLKLDIAIDLKGMTGDSRMHVFAQGLAPIQIHYLGYPGTTGAPYIDYNVVDHTVAPPEHRDSFTEALIYMPHCYQANDDQRAIPAPQTARADHDLPEDAFVLCCMNEPYKISPEEFDVWARVLRETPDAVLWLLAERDEARRNLRAEAADRGVDPDRLVFARKIGIVSHLERYRHADLFLDTFNVNAHTTASDALWAGVPVVTRIGRQFAARVAASLNQATGLSELVTETTAEYEALILDLCRDRERLGALRRRLQEGRMRWPLFDTKRFTRDFEAGLIAVAERHARGLPPEDIDLRRMAERDDAAPAATRIAAAS